MKLDDKVHTTLYIGEWHYVVFEEAEGDVKFTIDKNGGRLDVYFLAEGTRPSFVPNSFDYTKKVELQSGSVED